MAFTENLDVFFETNEFAVTAQFTSGVLVDEIINVIFDGESQTVSIAETNIEAETPQFICKTSDIAGAVRNDTIEINSVEYVIARIAKPDGTGTTTVYLKG